MFAQTTKLPEVLFLAQPSVDVNAILSCIKAAGFTVVVAFTSQDAVAVSLNNHFASIVLDAAHIRNDNWSVAKSLKLIKPSLPILLLDHRNANRRGAIPSDIDAVASCDNPKDVLVELRRLLSEKALSRRRVA